MNYQFSQTKFNDTFNVKLDKAADSLRLTHTQDICFKLFPYKAIVIIIRGLKIVFCIIENMNLKRRKIIII